MDLITLSALLFAWRIAAVMGRAADKLKAMTDDELLDQMNHSGHYDNKYRKEYARRHPVGALRA